MTDAPEMPEVIWAIRSDADNTILYGFTYPSPANGIDTPYILQSTHDAALAEKDARIAELQEIIERQGKDLLAAERGEF